MHSRRDDPKRGRRLYCSSFSRTGWAIPVLLLALQSTIAEAQSPTLAQTGRWRGLYELGPPYPNGYPGVHAAVLKGPADLTRALLFGQTGHFGVWSFVAGDSFVPPAIGVNFHGLAHPAHHLFCAGHATLNGRLVIVGGQYQPEVGTETAYEFNPLYTSPTETVFDPPSRIPPWQQLESTARGRWYATVTGLPTNQLLATSGTKYGYHFVFGGDTGSLSNDLRPLSMGGAADWAAPVTETLPPSVLPPVARKDHSAIMQYISTMDPHLARMVIFGGQIGPSQKTNDLSAQYLYGEHDSTSFWAAFTATPDAIHDLPAPRSRHTAIYYDGGVGNRIMIVYGGQDESGNALGDVWMLTLGTPTLGTNTGTWTRLLDGVALPNGPGNRYGHTAIFDPGPSNSQPRMLVFGGRISSSSLASTQVWSVNLTNPPHEWTAVLAAGGGSLTGREGHGAVGDDYADGTGNRFRMVIFGGHDGSDALNQTWSLSRPEGVDMWAWTPIGGGAPPHRWRHATCHDWFWDRMVVLGGQGSTGLLDDLWTLDLGGASPVWSPLSVNDPPTYEAPAARAGHTVVAHPWAIVERYPERFHPDLADNPPFPGEWATIPGAGRFIDPYPFMFVLPSGNVFHAGHRNDTRVLNTSTWSWGNSITATYALAGSAVMYRPGSILRCGRYGEDFKVGVSNTDTIRFSGPNDLNGGWASFAGTSLRQRKYHNLTVLPSGDVLVTGGLAADDSASKEKQPQLWSRGATEWSTDPPLDSDPAIRNYHSAAVLLPDGRVLSTGGEKFAAGPSPRDNPYRDIATVFEPPYLFNGNSYAQRPRIANAPCRIRYGEEFFINTPDLTAMAGGTVCLVRAGAVTHSFNQDQRYVPLDMYACGSTSRLRVLAPADSGIAPPGDYLLFIVKPPDPNNNNNRVPSIAKWVRVEYRPGAPPNCDADVPNRVNAPDPAVEIASDTEVWLYWTAPWDNPGPPSGGTVAEYDVRAGVSSMDEAAFCAGWRGNALEPLSVGGQSQYGWVSGLLPCTQYRIALKARDGTENWSPISNEAVVTTMCGGGGGGFNAQPGAPMVGAAPATGDGAALAQTANLHGASESEQAQPLGLVPSTAAAWAIEMGVADDAPVWSVYALAEVEAQGLFGTDSADIVVQDPVGQGRRLTRARLFPSATSTRFALRRLQRPGRLAFRGKFEFRQAWAAVETGTPGEVYKVVSARHSRLGDQTAAMDLASQTTTALLPGDTLSLIYRRSQSNTDDASGWFMIVGGPGAEVPTVRNRPSRPPTAAALPKVFALHTNRPNPFARSTSMRFALPRSEHVRIEVFDLLGRRVRTVADGAFEAGEHERPWDGRDAGGALVPAGVYLTRMHAGEFQAQRTMVLLPSGR